MRLTRQTYTYNIQDFTMGYVEPWTGHNTNMFADTLGIGLQAVHICVGASAMSACTHPPLDRGTFSTGGGHLTMVLNALVEVREV